MAGVAHPCSELAEHSDAEHVHNQALPVIHAFPHRHTKVVHFVRHGEGYHNGMKCLYAHSSLLIWISQLRNYLHDRAVAGRLDQAAYLSYDYFDAHLTEHGWRQAHALRDHIAALPEPLRVDAVIVSPLSRALETAAGAFGGGAWRSAEDGPPLMAALESEPVRQGPRHSFTLLTVRALQVIPEHSEDAALGQQSGVQPSGLTSFLFLCFFAAAPVTTAFGHLVKLLYLCAACGC